MLVISLDLEMNQPSGEIIEIGYTIGDPVSGEVKLKKSIYIKTGIPLGTTAEGMTMTELTNITDDDLNTYGVPLSEAYKTLCEDVKRWNPTTTVVQWGDGMKDSKGDHDYLRRELGLTWEEFIFRPRSWDVKSLLQIYRAFTRRSGVMGLKKAMASMDLEFIGREHRAVNDSHNTFIIFNAIGTKMRLFDEIKKSITSTIINK